MYIFLYNLFLVKSIWCKSTNRASAAIAGAGFALVSSLSTAFKNEISEVFPCAIIKMDLYCHVVAPVRRSVMMLAQALGIELNLMETDVLKRDQQIAAFQARSPQHCIPMLVDGDVIVWKSNATLT